LADITIGGALLAATLPLLLLIAFAIKWESPGPVLYRAPRIGRDGRRFELLHFRTCYSDSHVRSNRSRTGVGHFLYATRLDCLPEVFNLLRGDLSVFGTGLSPWSLF
jgi:lipopolysaccharide/colanic/teichoic acid biosynthesis glycosyltransferase